MALQDPSDSSSPPWRRGEAATPWTEEPLTLAETLAAPGGDATTRQSPVAPRPQAPEQESSGPRSFGEPRHERREDDAEATLPRQALLRRVQVPAGEEDWQDEERTPRQLHPLPRGLVELYGLLAVLFVLVPEWMASGALFGFREGRRGSDLPPPSGAWQRLPELRLASLNLAELRQLARSQGLMGYSRLSRQELTVRLLRRLKARP